MRRLLVPLLLFCLFPAPSQGKGQQVKNIILERLPPTLLLFGTGLAAFALSRRRNRG